MVQLAINHIVGGKKSGILHSSLYHIEIRFEIQGEPNHQAQPSEPVHSQQLELPSPVIPLPSLSVDDSDIGSILDSSPPAGNYSQHAICNM
jgi:hypothetical protein